MAGQGESVDEIPWPGFVDILSTVLIVFVFFMMIVSMIVFYLGTNYVKAADQAITEAHEKIASLQNPASAPEADPIPKEPVKETQQDEQNLVVAEKKYAQIATEIQEMTNFLQHIKATAMPSSQQEIQFANRKVKVFFKDFGSIPNEDNKKVLETFFRETVATCTGKVSIISRAPQRLTDYGWGQDVQLQRALAMRNFALEAGFQAQRIQVKMAQSLEKSDGFGMMETTCGQ